jgi:YfiH family protein
MTAGLRRRIAARGLDWIVPEWPAPPGIGALVTTRNGGVSRAPFATMNPGAHCGDDPAAVEANRRLLDQVAGRSPLWLAQVHGHDVVEVDAQSDAQSDAPVADAAIVRRPGRAAAVLVADCLPIMLADRRGGVAAVAHAGWRGLADGVAEATVAAMRVAPGSLIAWLGPAIGPAAFEVGADVHDVFCDADPDAARCFVPATRPQKWLADLYGLARLRLRHAGVIEIHGGGRCTVAEPATFFSYRREGVTGRMAALVWVCSSEGNENTGL